MQVDLFSGRLPPVWTDFRMVDGHVRLLNSFLSEREAWTLFEILMAAVAWRRDEIHTFGRRVPIPRLHQWMSEPRRTYAWSGIVMNPIPWTADVFFATRHAWTSPPRKSHWIMGVS
jgi:hypothetical protein